jgi:hypothetical protein
MAVEAGGGDEADRQRSGLRSAHHRGDRSTPSSNGQGCTGWRHTPWFKGAVSVVVIMPIPLGVGADVFWRANRSWRQPGASRGTAGTDEATAGPARAPALALEPVA